MMKKMRFFNSQNLCIRCDPTIWKIFKGSLEFTNNLFVPVCTMNVLPRTNKLYKIVFMQLSDAHTHFVSTNCDKGNHNKIPNMAREIEMKYLRI